MLREAIELQRTVPADSTPHAAAVDGKTRDGLIGALERHNAEHA
jgi:hypothetical protein